ncbi:Fusarisetin A cluster transcription factor fsa6 [Lachnellula suecica]|uniref:Fusarisetin A cluster transcription factor fsa6 n=1 Tax=Lachnellula suecica TaxID=602035 RepID=A0A8T9C228_9HELO|nr:Fusarisetin A cluster transcription factor fsa6 [Lachnellula suecica]
MSQLSGFTGKFKVNSNESSKVTKRPRESLTVNNREAEDRLAHLESLVKNLMQERVGAPAQPLTPQDTHLDPEATVVQPRKGQNDNGSYVGSTHWSAVLDDIQELRTVLSGSAEAPEPEAYVASKRPAINSELIFGSFNAYSVQSFISEYLPPKVQVDRYLSTYFRGTTFIVPFIHTYHFQRQYQKLWADTTSVNPLWLSILFSICYMASLKDGENRQYSSVQSGLPGRPAFHSAAAKCLVLGEYHRPQEFAVEALAMYGHGKNLQTLDPSREAGAILGMVVRMAYELGYHRDPSSFGAFTVFEGEMRRRVWAALKQMDSMISFQLGLPSIICLENCDAKSPRILLDSDFDTDTKALPASRSDNEPENRLLWFFVKDRIMTSFSKVCQDALSFKKKSPNEILQLDEKVRQMYTAIPDVLRARPLCESIADPPFLIMTRLYVEFMILKSLCVLHRKYMARGNVYSTKVCVEAGKKLVSQIIEMYNEYAPGGQLQNERWMLTNFTMNDFLMGVMVLCLVVHTRWKNGLQNSVISTETESEVLELLRQSHTICVDKSPVSRDARRVSYAIRLTLNGAKSPNTPKLPASQTQTANLPKAGELKSNDLASQFNPNQALGQNDETAFGLLDPFNFMGDDVENIDWASFDPQIFGNTSLSESFSLP